ncbi:uncharacterized protein [Paralichthys olivaceus]|uniref:uncharacterized protein isoform X1 n=2 Tax=Paralichthys olivaceus TaxID=8255 RepID=UPI003752E6BD
MDIPTCGTVKSKIEALRKTLKQEDELLREKEKMPAGSKAHNGKLAVQGNKVKALEEDNVALKKKVAPLIRDFSRVELVVTEVEERQAHSQKIDSMDKETQTSELPWKPWSPSPLHHLPEWLPANRFPPQLSSLWVAVGSRTSVLQVPTAHATDMARDAHTNITTGYGCREVMETGSTTLTGEAVYVVSTTMRIVDIQTYISELQHYIDIRCIIISRLHVINS